MGLGLGVGLEVRRYRVEALGGRELDQNPSGEGGTIASEEEADEVAANG